MTTSFSSPKRNKTEEELETTYDKWLYVLKHLPNLTERPKKLQERIFQKLFEAAEIAKFTPEEKEQYEQSLKSYRDLKNVIDTAFVEGETKGKIEEKTSNITKPRINWYNALYLKTHKFQTRSPKPYVFTILQKPKGKEVFFAYSKIGSE